MSVWSLERQLTTAFALVAITVAGVSVVSVGSARQHRADAATVTHTRDVLETLQSTLRSMIDAETAMRGYLIANKQEEYLEPLRLARSSVGGDVERLRSLTAKDADQQLRLRDLEGLVQRQLEYRDGVIRIARAQGVGAALQLAGRGQGKVGMDSVRHVTDAMKRHEDRLLLQRQEASQLSDRRATALLNVLMGLLAAIVLGSYLVTRSNLSARVAAEGALQQLNAGLERRVQERTAQVRESEARLTFALRKIRTGGWDLDLVDHSTHRTLEHDRIFGYDSPLPQWTYEMFLEHVLPEDREDVDRRFREATASHGEWSFECRIRRVDGAVRWIWATGEHQTDELGSTRRMAGVVQDISERKEAEDALRASQTQYRALFDSMLEGFCVIELVVGADGAPSDYRFLETNAAFEAQTGLRNTQGKLRKEALPKADSNLLGIYAQVVATGEPFRRVMESPDLKRWFDMSAYRVGDPGHRKVAIVFSDITELKRAERKVLGQLEHLNLLDQITRSIGERQDLRSIFQVVVRSIEDSLPVDFACICLHDPVASALTVTCVGVKSAPLAHDLTMDEQATIGIGGNGLARCVQGYLVYEPNISEVQFPFPQRLASGGLGSVVMAPLKSESLVFGVLVAGRQDAGAFSSTECEFLRQLSEHVALAAHQAQIHEALQKAYDDLRKTQQAVMQEERLRALGQMASGIAHDINNALSPVSLYTESMLETERHLSDRSRGYLVTIQRAVEDVAQTVARLREFYRPREAQLQLTPVQLNDMVKQVVELTRARWYDMPQQSGVDIHAATELAPDLPRIMGAESEIRESLTNLVFNAVDAMPEGGTFTLRTRLVNDDAGHASAVLEVSDAGAGMDEETRRRCLEPFFTTKGERGTGLGLAMVYGMVQRHSAEIAIESAPGAGTTVSLTFAVPAILQEDAQSIVASTAPSRLRLLLIDDDPIILKAVCDALEMDGHVVVTANGGEAGIAAFRTSLSGSTRFAAVITDLGMPQVDGRRVASAVKAASKATPVIMLTGWGQRLMAEGDTPPHVDRVLAKPPKLRELRTALAALCAPTAR